MKYRPNALESLEVLSGEGDSEGDFFLIESGLQGNIEFFGSCEGNGDFLYSPSARFPEMSEEDFYRKLSELAEKALAETLEFLESGPSD